MIKFKTFANPGKFLRIAALVLPWSSGLAAIFLTVGCYLALFVSPPDYQQSDSVRIMYVHVPAAWMALSCYTGVAVSAAVWLVWRHQIAECWARATAPLGAGFTIICLVSGSLWGEPMWGTWWVWDARLTSVLVLFFLYIGYITLANAFDDHEQGARASAILAVIGWINVPIVKYSVEWWNTLHQPASISQFNKSSIDPSMIAPLLVMAAGFALLFLSLALMRVRTELILRQLVVRSFSSDIYK